MSCWYISLTWKVICSLSMTFSYTLNITFCLRQKHWLFMASVCVWWILISIVDKSCSNLKSNDSFGFYSSRGFWSTPSKLNLMKYKLSYLRSNTNPPFKIKDILFNILINSLSKLTLEINNSFINLMMSRFQKFPWLLVKYA